MPTLRELIYQVMSPGGVTEAGMKVLAPELFNDVPKKK